MSLDNAADLDSIQTQAQTHAVNGNAHAAVADLVQQQTPTAHHSSPEAAAQAEEKNAVKAAVLSPGKSEDSSQVSIDHDARYFVGAINSGVAFQSSCR